MLIQATARPAEVDRRGALPGVELRGLVKRWRTPAGPVEAVAGVDLSIAPGETVALLGPNGAGKSTTIDLMLGLARPDAGTVSILGMEPPAAVDAGAVGAMLQTGELLRDLTVRELVTLTASLFPAPIAVEEAIELAGLEPVAGRRTNRLSGGQAQRVRAAIALVGDPQLLVLDEPTVAMDVDGRRAFWATMRAFAARGRTIVFATHYLDEADAYADRAVLMARGRVVADGPTTEIKAKVGARTIRATLPAADLAALRALPGVIAAERHGDAVVLACADSDAAIRALLAAHPFVRDIEISGAGLEQAFLQLTGEDDHAGAQPAAGAPPAAAPPRPVPSAAELPAPARRR
jgi:ABC-2 type transport system ATP-binding protein